MARQLERVIEKDAATGAAEERAAVSSVVRALDQQAHAMEATHARFLGDMSHHWEEYSRVYENLPAVVEVRMQADRLAGGGGREVRGKERVGGEGVRGRAA